MNTNNQSVEHRPALVVAAADTADVVRAVQYARAHGLSVAVQTTGHGMSLPSDGVLISTQRLNRVEIDAGTRIARVQGGARWLDVIPAAAAYGLAPLNGSSPQVGVVGFMLGGGVGMLGRQHGYAADHIRSLRIVTADGEERRVDPDSDPELFWAVRGGKGNLGVVTQIEFDLFEVSDLYGGGLYFPAETVAQLLELYVAWTLDLPRTMSTSILLSRYPDIEQVRAELRGKYVAHLRVAYFGPAEEAERLLRPVRELDAPLLDTVGAMPYTDIGTIHHEPVGPYSVYESGFYTGYLAASDTRTILKRVGPDVNAPLIFELRHHGGGYRTLPAISNPVGGRDAEFTIYIGSVIDPPAMTTDKAIHTAIRDDFAHVDRGTVLNFLGAHTDFETIHRAFLPEDAGRLIAVQQKRDPQNVFCINHRLAAQEGASH
nr:FAD-binding oxidoreductase [Naumannella cuiyingiana]